MNPVELVEKKYMEKEVPEFSPGDVVRVNVKIREGDKFRIQAFEGAVIKRKNGGLQSTFTVRKVTSGYGVERTFMLYSPMIDSIHRLRRGRVRRSKLYYLRERKGKAARIKEIR